MVVSACLLFIYLGFYLFQAYRRKNAVEPMKANMVSMAVSMVSSLLIGLMIGFSLQGHLAFSTIWSILTSFVIAFVIGKPFGEMAVIEALGAGLMGGMMGAMLGEMLPSGDWNKMQLFMNILYILSMSFMMQLLSMKENAFNIKRAISALLPILIVTSLSFFDERIHQNTEINNHQMQHEIQTNGIGGPLCTP